MRTIDLVNGLRTPGEAIALDARPKIKSQSQIYRYGRSIFCLSHRPKISGLFDLCRHWVSVVRDFYHQTYQYFNGYMYIFSIFQCDICLAFWVDFQHLQIIERTDHFNCFNHKISKLNSKFQITVYALASWNEQWF